MTMKKRTREELMEATFRDMWKRGELERKIIYVPSCMGYTFEKIIYHVKPDERRKKP